MTRDELAAAVPIRERDGRPYFVLMADIPEPWHSQFLKALVGSACPKATIITSQLPVEHWHAWIGDATIADAILDRIMHQPGRQ